MPPMDSLRLAKGIGSFSGRLDLVGNQVQLCMHGWEKANPAIKKRLLRRTINGIVVTREELFITFWMSAAEQTDGLREAGVNESQGGSNLVPLPRNSAGTRNRNLSVLGSGDVRNGSPDRTLPETLQAHKIIAFFDADSEGISENFVQLYQKGLSLREIAKQTGKAKSTVRDALLKAGIELRPKTAPPVHSSWRGSGRRGVRPYYGFCYFQGRVVPDPREYDNLVLIHRLWRSGANPNRIAATLNAKKVPARSAAAWNRNSVVLILKRFEQSIISIKGDHYELR